VVNVSLDPVKYSVEVHLAAQEYLAAVQRQLQSEPGHLEKLAIEESNMAEMDGEPISEEEKSVIMGKHKASSPFAMDVAAAQAKLTEAIKR
jgi:hypothetical protein